MNHEALLVHQRRSLKHLKLKLGAAEAVIHCDFGENFSAKYSSEVQSFHFGGSRKHQSFCSLSEINDHGPAAVWARMKPIFDIFEKSKFQT